MATTTDIAQTSAKLRLLVSCLLVTLAALLLLERFGAVGMQLTREGFAADVLRRFAAQCIAACPELLYLLALWCIRQALSAFASGKLYTPTVTRMLDCVGTMLAIGSFVSVFVVPSATRGVGFGPGYVIAYDVSGLVLGAVGLSLKIIAHVFRRAADMETELREIF
jgi:hypothetical protein